MAPVLAKDCYAVEGYLPPCLECFFGTSHRHSHCFNAPSKQDVAGATGRKCTPFAAWVDEYLFLPWPPCEILAADIALVPPSSSCGP